MLKYDSNGRNLCTTFTEKNMFLYFRVWVAEYPESKLKNGFFLTYKVCSRFKLSKTRWLVSSHFWSLLKQVRIVDAA